MGNDRSFGYTVPSVNDVDRYVQMGYEIERAQRRIAAIRMYRDAHEANDGRSMEHALLAWKESK